MTKKILIHATPSPLDTYTPEEVWMQNLVHNNMGNVAFPFGLFRNLTMEDTTVVSDWYGKKLPSPEEVNANYEAYILPMANDFGGHFVKEMVALTEFINKLTIPVVVVGIGGAFSDDNPSFDKPRSYDEVSKNFINAVLNHSDKLGLRGEITGRYLESLGYIEGKHFQVIGDPTLYNFGSNLKIRDFKLTNTTRIAFNMTPSAPEQALRFLNKIPENFENVAYIPQDLAEFSKIYAGQMTMGGKVLRDELDYFPNNFNDIVYRDGKIKWYMSAPSWIEDMKNFDLSIGTRIHGNILPTAAGTPTLTMYFGARLRELTEFHHLPRIDAKTVNPNDTLEDLIQNVDFHEPERYHRENYNNFVRFMDDNGLNHSYKHTTEELPFDRQLAQTELLPPIVPINKVTDVEELQHRIQVGYSMSQKGLIREKKQKEKLAKRVREVEKALNKIESVSVKPVEKTLAKLSGKTLINRRQLTLYPNLDISIPSKVYAPGTKVTIEAIIQEEGQNYVQIDGLFARADVTDFTKVRANLADFIVNNVHNVEVMKTIGLYKSVNFNSDDKIGVIKANTKVDVLSIDWTLGGTPRLRIEQGYISANKMYVRNLEAKFNFWGKK